MSAVAEMPETPEAPAPFRTYGEGQENFLHDLKHKIIGFCSGKGGGKSTIGAQKTAELHILNAGFVDGRAFQPKPVRSLVIAPSFQMLNTVNVPQILDAFERIGLQANFVSSPNRFCIEVPELGTKARPSELLLRSAEAPEKINGFEVGAIWPDEASLYPWSEENPLEDAITQALGRMRDPRAKIHQMNCTFTPEGPGTRMFKMFSEPHPDRAIYYGSTTDVPMMADYVEVMRQQLTPELFQQYVMGKTLDSAGSRVFSAFDPDRNLDARLHLDYLLPLHLAIDWNIAPGMHAILGQKFPQPELLTSVHEIFESRMDVRRMVWRLKEMLDAWQWPKDSVIQVFADATGAAKHASTGTSCLDVLAQSLQAAGLLFSFMHIPTSNPPVADRVNACNAALFNAFGEIRWKIHPQCKQLVTDLKQMRWGTDGKISKGDRERGHGVDADGYRVWQLMPIRYRRKQEYTGPQVGFAGPGFYG